MTKFAFAFYHHNHLSGGMPPLQGQVLKPLTAHPQGASEDEEHHVRQVRDDLLPQLQLEEALGDRPRGEQADGRAALGLSHPGTPCRYGKLSSFSFAA